MVNFNCIDKEGNARSFDYTIEHDELKEEWSFRVFNIPPLSSGEFFEITVKEISDDELRIVMMENHRIPEYSGAGIPDFMIPEIAKVLQKNIVSSSNKTPREDGFRTKDGTKVWERLKANEKATYDPETDTYRLA